MKNNPIIIIGAGRSGTNILRDSICAVKGFETWPCDEINYIWRHGNIQKKNDRFTADDATPEVKKFIQNQFQKLEKEFDAEFVVEKTCANSLKIPFINQIYPEAKYIFIAREGHDVASSAKQRWTAPLEMGYIMKKVKYVPKSDIIHYGLRYFINRVKKIFSKEKRLAYWGPLYPGMLDDLKNDSLIEVCAKQWRACVETAVSDLKTLNPEQVYFVKYEDFVLQPTEEMKKIFQFLGYKNAPEEVIKESVKKVSPRSVGNYKKHLSQQEIDLIEPIIQPVIDNIYKKL